MKLFNPKLVLPDLSKSPTSIGGIFPLADLSYTYSYVLGEAPVGYLRMHLVYVQSGRRQVVVNRVCKSIGVDGEPTGNPCPYCDESIPTSTNVLLNTWPSLTSVGFLDAVKHRRNGSVHSGLKVLILPIRDICKMLNVDTPHSVEDIDHALSLLYGRVLWVGRHGQHDNGRSKYSHDNLCRTKTSEVRNLYPLFDFRHPHFYESMLTSPEGDVSTLEGAVG
jgi:hypothetical protein